ncbi:MAG TPA: hypothetical protein VGS10_02035 [Terracidiphilus sp.]|nr:hypothetical protein [Terracidiphilus sp.]
MPGTSVDLTLRKRALFENQPPDSVRLRARSVRLGADGVGFIIETEHVAADIWKSLFLKAARVTRQHDTVRVLRVSRALAFLRRISPAAESAILEHIAGESIFESGERSVETILNAEVLVESWNFAIRTGVSPTLILSILENASRTNSDWVRQHWSGLLASSVQYWARDRESAQFVTLLSMLEPVQIRILDAACSRALRAEREAGYYAPRIPAYSRAALRNLAGISDFPTIEQHLDCLAYLDLLEPTIKSDLFEKIEQINLTPTRPGLRFYARCRGLLEPPDAPVRLHERPVIQLQAAKDNSDLANREARRIYAGVS